MKFRKLRIAWSVGWGILAVLLSWFNVKWNFRFGALAS